jgi:hypothetical protein
MKKLQFIVRYWKVGKLLHIVSFIAACIALWTFSVLRYLQFEPNPMLWLIWLIIFISFFNMSMLAQLDSFSRFQNYKQVKDQIFLNGFQLRILKPLAKSSCQREAAILAGIELGYDKEIKNYFYKLGYRWYHIIPDFVFNDPLFFFTRLFWRTTFFAAYYTPKVNYELKVAI